MNELRVVFAAALLASRQDTSAASTPADEAAVADTVERARRLYSAARSLVLDCPPSLERVWRMTDAQVSLIVSHVSRVVGLTPRGALARAPAGLPTSAPRPEDCVFEHASHLFVAAVGQGLPLDRAMALFSCLGGGRYSHDDHCFYPCTASLGPLSVRLALLAKSDRFVVPGADGEGNITLFIHPEGICAVVSDRRLRSRHLADIHRAPGGLLSLPDFICLPRDESGRPIVPKSSVTALVEAQEAWHSELGPIDGVSSAIVRGLLVMPKIAAPSQQTVLRNHPSFKNDAAAKAALGPVIAKWLAEGIRLGSEGGDAFGRAGVRHCDLLGSRSRARTGSVG